MKKLIGAALLAGAAIGTAGAAHAEGTMSGSVNFTTDYVFRGLSQTTGSPAIQGSLDYTDDASSIPWYAGVWGSNVDFGTGGGNLETDLYAGVRPKTGPVSWDIGILGYFYPGAHDDGAEQDYYEGAVSASMDVMTNLNLGVAVNYSPDFFGETGTGLYGEVNGTYKVSDALSFTAAYGAQNVDDIGSYNTWNIGATYAWQGFNLGLTYSDTDGADEFVTSFDDQAADSRVVFSVGRSL